MHANNPGTRHRAIIGKTISSLYVSAIHPHTAGAIPPIPKLKKNDIPYPRPLCAFDVISANKAFDIGWFEKYTIPNTILHNNTSL